MSNIETAKEIDRELEKLPVELRSPIYSLAYEYGHSSGIHEVKNYVLDFVYAINSPLERITNEAYQKGFHEAMVKYKKVEK